MSAVAKSNPFEALNNEPRFNIFDFLVPRERKVNQLVSKVFGRMIATYIKTDFSGALCQTILLRSRPPFGQKQAKELGKMSTKH
jgi:hypothetical protein